MPPDATIIVVGYNAAETLPATIDSIRRQTHRRWQAVIVDDGSTDQTPALLAARCGTDARFALRRTAHAGAAAAVNHGIAHAAADRILFLAADDLLRPDALANLLLAADATGGRAVIAGGLEMLDAAGNPLGIFNRPAPGGTGLDQLLLGNRIPATSLVPRALLGGQPFDPELPACEDWDFWLRLAHRGTRFAVIPSIIYGYRLRATSLSHQVDCLHAAGRRVVDRWLPKAVNPKAVRDARHRWAWACGALAFVQGSPAALRQYSGDLPALEPTDAFRLDAASRIHWALQFVHGAVGRTWRECADGWLREAAAWLNSGPLADQADGILAHLAAMARPAQDQLSAVRQFVARRTDCRRVVLYGLGTNGVSLLSEWRQIPELHCCELWGADDHAPPLTFSLLGLPRDDPRTWRHWPRGTVVIVTPNDYRNLRATCLRAGGREGGDFFVVTAGARAVAPSGDHPRPRAKEAVSL
jgi:hypothetical protein